MFVVKSIVIQINGSNYGSINYVLGKNFIEIWIYVNV